MGRGSTRWPGLIPGLLLLCIAPGPAAAEKYEMDKADSYFVAITDKGGLFSFAGHRHAVLATQWKVEAAINPADMERASIEILVPAADLVIDSDEARKVAGLGSGPGPDDVRKIQAKMLGPGVLDAAAYANLRFASTQVKRAGKAELRIAGQFTLHGKSRDVRLPVRYSETGGGGLRFTGEFTVKQTDYGIEPESAGMGTVNVKDEVTIRFRVALKPVR